MIGMVLVTHGRLAEELVAALEHVVGSQPNIVSICIGPNDNMEERRSEIMESSIKADEGDGVVLLTDMFGGTPSNLAISIMEKANVEIIAGVNLPMLIKLASVRKTEPLKKAIESAQDSGRKYINIASKILSK
jgi:PTS system mannose-specific IIA component